MPFLNYTGKDSNGHTLSKGDTVLVNYPAKVRTALHLEHTHKNR